MTVADTLRDAWRATAAATADPRWARSPEPADGSSEAGVHSSRRWADPWSPWDPHHAPLGGVGARAAKAGSGPDMTIPGLDLPTGRRDPGGSAATGGAAAGGLGDPLGRAASGSPASARSAGGVLAVLCPPIVVLAGGAAVIGSTMTWATVRAFGLVELAVRGTDPDQHGHLTMLLGILAMVAGLLLAGRRVDWGRMLAVIAGLMLLLTTVVDVARLRQGGVFAGTGLERATDLGPGLWVVGASGVVLVLVGFLVRYATPVHPSDPPPRPARS